VVREARASRTAQQLTATPPGVLSAAYADVLRAAPVLDQRVFVEVFARGRSPAVADQWYARAAWHAAAYVGECADQSAAISCLLDTGA